MICIAAGYVLLVALVVDAWWRRYNIESDYILLQADYLKLSKAHKKLQEEHLQVLRGRAADILRGELRKVN